MGFDSIPCIAMPGEMVVHSTLDGQHVHEPSLRATRVRCEYCESLVEHVSNCCNCGAALPSASGQALLSEYNQGILSGVTVEQAGRAMRNALGLPNPRPPIPSDGQEVPQ